MSSGGVMLTGWLRKSPPENKLKSRHHSWKKRWFVLKSGRLTGDPNVLEYSKYHTSKRPIKIIDLNDCKQIDVNVNVPVRGDKKDKDARHFIFSIVTSHRTFYLIADTSREMSSWVRSLCDLCGFNYDAISGKEGLGEEKKTFSSSATSLVLPTSRVTASSPAITRETGASNNGPRELAQHKVQCPNGTVNTSFRHSCNNGYDSAEAQPQSTSRAELQNGAVHYHNNFIQSATLERNAALMNTTDDSHEYLHLANCESDTRKGSTDSVFTHEESKPAEDLAPLRSLARFKDKVRLDSMPNVPPPAPPVGPEGLGNLDFDYDDDDAFEDAEPRPTSKSMIARRPYDVSDSLYNAQSRIPHGANVRDEGMQWPGRTSSSFSSPRMMQPTEYINTSSMSTASDMAESPFAINDPHATLSIVPGRLTLDRHTLNSPVFPMPHKPNRDAEDTLRADRHMLNVSETLECRTTYNEPQLTPHAPPARPPKPTDLTSKSNGHTPLKPVNVVVVSPATSNGEPQSLLLPSRSDTAGSESSVVSPDTSKWTNHCSPSSVSATRFGSETDTTAYETPNSAKPSLVQSTKAEPCPSLHVDTIESMADIDNIDDYEKMAGGGYMNDNAPIDDTGLYTAMSGTPTNGPPPGLGLSGPAITCHANNETPPPVHRDLKPGRKSLGSDGGSSHSGHEFRHNSFRDSYTSDEGLSPPHTAVFPSPQPSEKSFTNMGSPSPCQSNGSVSQWLLPQRSPRTGVCGNLPPSPLVSPALAHVSRSPGHSSSMRSPDKISVAPERPPKPLSMKYPPRPSEDSLIPPRRPPKPGDGPGQAHVRKMLTPSAVVPPPSAIESDERDIKYIEIATPTRPGQIHVSDPTQERNVDKDLVEYTHIDAGKTRALEIMKKERQGKMHQKAHPD